MTRLLASVTDVEEAMIALGGGADIIDLKNPLEGALGALPIPVIEQVVETVGKRKSVSATIGDIPMQPDLIGLRVQQVAATGVDFVKIGFFGREGHAACIEAMQPLTAQGTRIVAVLFADAQPDLGLIPLLERSGFHGVMLDTARKNGKRLTDWLSLAFLGQFVAQSRHHGLLTGLAGSLASTDIEILSPLQPDYLGFRGGLCKRSDRTSSLAPSRLEAVGRLLRQYNSQTLEMA